MNKIKLATQLKSKLRSASVRETLNRDEPSSSCNSSLSTSLVSSKLPSIEAGNVASMDLDRECILERSRLVTGAPPRMPFVGFYGRYNKRWYVDIVTLPHNAIRTLITSGFDLLISVYRLSLDMTDKDFKLLFKYLLEFVDFTKVILESEEKVLYPEIEKELKKRKDYEDLLVNMNNRKQRKQEIIRLLCSLIDDRMMNQASVIIAITLQEKLDEISLQMFDYFKNKENILPKLFIKSTRGMKEKTRMENKLIRYLSQITSSLDRQYDYMAYLVLPLHTDQVRIDFEERHFNKNQRNHFANSVQRVRYEIMNIPKAFQDAASNYESRFSMAAFLQHYDTHGNDNKTVNNQLI